MSTTFDFIVVGSGFGGSVSALRLVEKGYKVLLLEKGRRFAPEDFPKSNWDLKKWMWWPSLGGRGLFQENADGWNVQLAHLDQLDRGSWPELGIQQRIDEKVSRARVTRETGDNTAIVRSARKFPVDAVHGFKMAPAFFNV